MKRLDNKSRCPVNFAVEIFGDTWSLLIIRDMISVGKKTFNEFLNSSEAIAPSILAERLMHLEHKGIISKKADSHDKRRMIYSLTEKGIKTIPLIYELSAWGSHISPDPDASDEWFAALKLDKQSVLEAWREAVETGSSFMNGSNSVIRQLNLR